MHLSLLKNRPGSKISSPELLDFTTARYVRLRIQGMHTTIDSVDKSIQWLVDQDALDKRSFYSIRSIKIIGRLYCSGHADKIVDVLVDNVCICNSYIFRLYSNNKLKYLYII